MEDNSNNDSGESLRRRTKFEPLKISELRLLDEICDRDEECNASNKIEQDKLLNDTDDELIPLDTIEELEESNSQLRNSTGQTIKTTTLVPDLKDTQKSFLETPVKNMAVALVRPDPCFSHKSLFKTQEVKQEVIPLKSQIGFVQTPVQNCKEYEQKLVQSLPPKQGGSYEIQRYYGQGNSNVRRPLMETHKVQTFNDNLAHYSKNHVIHFSTSGNPVQNEMKANVLRDLKSEESKSKNQLAIFPIEKYAKENRVPYTNQCARQNEFESQKSSVPIEQNVKEKNIMVPPMMEKKCETPMSHIEIRQPIPYSHTRDNNPSVLQKPIETCSRSNSLENKPLNVQFAVPKSLSVIKDKMLVVKGKNYHVLNCIGQGMCGKVLQTQEMESMELRAIKYVNIIRMDKSSVQGCLDEIALLNKLQAQCIVHMYDYEIRKNQIFVVMELGETDLNTILKNALSERKIPTTMILHYWKEMLAAVKHIHDNDVIHSDLKPANFISVKGRLKLIDFGIATTINADHTSVIRESQTGTLNFISPEALTESNPNSDNKLYKISKKSDVWSLGCILYCLVYGFTPFQHITNVWQKIGAITDPQTKIQYPQLRDNDTVDPLPAIVIEVIKKCLKHNPKERPSVDNLLQIQYISCNCSMFSRLSMSSRQPIIDKVKSFLSNEEWTEFVQTFSSINRKAA